jgi:nucleoside-diphosphate-sugar epimerase
MRIVVTGSQGFIGRPLASALAAGGHAVRRADVAGGASPPVDVTRESDCGTACEGAEVVIHCAAVHESGAVKADPLRMIAINVRGTLNMLRAAADAGVRRFVLLSTGKVYGEPESLPSHETQLPLPLEPYALAKFVNEEYARRFHAVSRMEVVVVRPFSVYGPEQDLDTGYVGMLLRGLRDGTAVELPAAPTFLRDFVYITDVVELCRRAALSPMPGLTILNAGSGQPTRLDDLVSILGQLTGRQLEVSYKPPGPGTLTRTLAAMNLAAELLDYSPRITLETGLQRTVDWFFYQAPRAAGAAR